MLKQDVDLDIISGPGRSDSTRRFENLYSLERYEQGDISLEEEVVATMNEGRRLIYGYLFRFIGLIALFFLFYTFYRGMVFAVDVHFNDKTLERFLDRIHDNIDDRHLDFIRGISDITFYIFVIILISRFVLFYPIIFNVQLLLRFASIYVFTYLVRGLIVFFTTIPSPYPYCTSLVKSDEWWKTYATMLFGRGVADCTGLLFSGRAYIVFMGMIIMAQNSGIIFSFLMSIYAFITTASIVASKVHYTIDVMFSLLIAGTFYYFYYSRIDTFGVQFINEINTRKYSTDEEIRHSKLERSVVNQWLSSIEQIPKLLSVGHKIKLLQPLVYQNTSIHEGVFKEFKTMLYFFGLKNCDDVLSLYRGTSSFNFSYWKKLKFVGRKNKPGISTEE